MAATGVEWIDHFHDPCSQVNLSYRGKHALDFQNNMAAVGHKAVYAWGDDNAWETDFRDYAFGGDSYHPIGPFTGSEDVEFCYFASHGGNWSNIMHIAFAVTHAYCLGSSDTWKLGYWGNLKWLVLDCCQAVLGTDSASVCNVWGGPMQGIHQVFGFVNDGHDAWWNRNLGGDFANDICGWGAVLADCWINQAYSLWLNDCAIAIAAGTTQEQAIARRDWEWLFSQPSAPVPAEWLAWKWRG
jgi:Family of unknown function (DUF6345)